MITKEAPASSESLGVGLGRSEDGPIAGLNGLGSCESALEGIVVSTDSGCVFEDGWACSAGTDDSVVGGMVEGGGSRCRGIVV